MRDYFPFRSPEGKAEYLAWYDQQLGTWPVAKETCMVETAHGTTCVHISGSPTAPPMVLLPGMGSNSLAWLAYVAALSEHYRTYALDTIYDYGRSVRKPTFQKADVADWLDGVLVALGLESGVDVVGVSLGAWLSSQYALRCPRRLRKLVWLTPAGIIQAVSWNALARALLSALLPGLFLKPFLAYISPNLQSSAAGQAITGQLAKDIVLARRCFQALAVMGPTVLSDAELDKLTMPILCLIGANERFYSAAKAMARLQRVAPRICAEMVPQVGHDMTAIRVEETTRRVLAFLNEP